MAQGNDRRRSGARGDRGGQVPFSVPGGQREDGARSGDRARRRAEARRRSFANGPLPDWQPDSARSDYDRSGRYGRNGRNGDSQTRGGRYSRGADSSGGRSTRGSARHATRSSAGPRATLVMLVLALAVLIGGGLAVVRLVIAPNSGQTPARESQQAIEASDMSASSSAASASEGSESSEGAPASPDADAPASRVHDLAPLSLLTVPGSDSVVSIVLDSGSFSSADCGFDTSAIQAAVANVEELGDCGFVFLDVDSGRGISYHADLPTYIASASKAVLAQYALLSGAEGDESGRYNIEEAILYSDNDAYEGFGYVYADGGYGDWLDLHQAWFDNYTYDLYPPMSARSLASFWAETLMYLQTESEAAQWFGDLLGSTSTSFIRDGIAPTGASVKNKAGWIGEEGYESVTDAGLIDEGGHTYLMAIVTGQFDGDTAEGNVSDLARAIFDARGNL